MSSIRRQDTQATSGMIALRFVNGQGGNSNVK